MKKKTSFELQFMLIGTLVFMMTIGGTLAFMSDRTGEIKNQFIPVDIDSHVQDDYSIKNVSEDIPGFVRAYVTVNYVDSEGKYHFVSDTSSYVTLGTNWVKGADGYFYYTKLVPKQQLTTPVVTVNASASANFNIQVQVISDIIQGDPALVVTTTWESATAVSADGQTLTVATGN